MSTAITYRLLLVQPNVIFRARVNQTTFAGNAAQVTYTGVEGDCADIEREMMVLFGTSEGADDLGRARVRRPATANTLYFGWASRSKGEGEAYLQDDAYITVIDLFRPWTRNPRISDDGVTFTDYDRDLNTYRAQSMPPIVNLDCGPAVQADLDPETGLATFTFNATHTYMTDPDAAAMYAAFNWKLPAEADLIDGAIDTHYVQFTLPEGAWWVKAMETSSEGGVGVRWVLCVAGEPAGTLSRFDQVALTRRPEGQTLRVRVSEPVPLDTYPNGCMAVLWKRQTENGVPVKPSGLAGNEHICFVGWHYQDDLSGTASETGYIDETQLEFRDVGGWLAALPGYPIVVERKQNPDRWEHLKRANIDYYYNRILTEYSNVLSLTDFIWSGLGYDYYTFSTLASEGQSLYEQIDGRAQAIAHKFTCDQWSRLRIAPDPALLDDNAGSGTVIKRTNTVQKALGEGEWASVQATNLPFPRANWNWGSAIVAKAVDADQATSIGTVFCVAPGKAPSQGTAQQQSGEQLVVSQAELNAREGHRYAARMNNPLPSIEIELAGVDDYAIQPALMQWVTLDISAQTAGQRGRVYDGARFLPVEVEITHDAETGTQRVMLRAEKESVGTPAETYYMPETDYGIEEPYEPPTDYGFDWDDPLGKAQRKIFLIHESGEVSITADFTTPGLVGGPTYNVVDLSLDGTVLGAVTDPYSPRYLGTGPGVNGWIVTTTRIYRVQDIAGVTERTVTSQHTFATPSNYRVIQTERGTQNWVVVASYYPGVGTKVCYTTNGGSTWTEVTVSASVMGGGTVPRMAWTTVQETFKSGGTGPDGTFELTPSGSVLNVAWTRPGGNFDEIGLRVYVTCDDPVSSVMWRVRRLELNPTASMDWLLPGNSYKDTRDLLRPYFDPNGGDTLTDLGNDGTWASFRINYHTPRTISNWRSWGGGWRGTPNPTGYSNTNNVQFEILQVNGEDNEQVLDEVLACPALHVSAKVAGLCYVGAVNDGAGDLYVSTNYGATWSLASTPAHDFGNALGGAFHFPWHNNPLDALYYWGKYDNGTPAWASFLSNGASVSEITPPGAYGPAGPRAWSSSPMNRLEMALMGMTADGAHAGFRSTSGGGAWATILSPASRAMAYVGCHVPDDPTVLYVWGPAGVGYSANAGANIDSRIGNASASEVVQIGGW